MVQAHWKNKKVVYHTLRWYLDKSLLLEGHYRVQLESIIKYFFETNIGTVSDMIVLDAFKAYMRGMLISINIPRVRE